MMIENNKIDDVINELTKRIDKLEAENAMLKEKMNEGEIRETEDKETDDWSTWKYVLAIIWTIVSVIVFFCMFGEISQSLFR